MKYVAGMKLTLIFFLLLSAPAAFADDQEKTQKKALEQQANELIKEAKELEKSGQVLEARSRYAGSQAFWETKDAIQAIKHIDEAIHNRVKDALRQAHKLYDQGQFKPAADVLENALKLGESTAILSYDLALCYQRTGDTDASLAYLDQAASATPDPKRRLKLQQLRTALVTGEQPIGWKDADRGRIDTVNGMVDSIGFEAFLNEGPPSLQQESEKPGSPAVSAALTSNATASSAKSARRSSSLCQALKSLGSLPANSPTFSFNLANCAEDNDRPAEASGLLTRYLQMSPRAADADRVRLRITDLNALAELPGQKGAQVRTIYASASRSLDERRYDRALIEFQKAAATDPSFAPTEWRLALLYEAMGNVGRAKQSFDRFRELESDPAAREAAGVHLETLAIKRETYDTEVAAAEEILSDLLNRAMNLTFNGMENRDALYKQRAKATKKLYKKSQHLNRVGGFSVPFAYARQQLADAGDHLATALALFPLGAEANQLMGLVFLQANDGRSAMRCFDAVAAQNLPVSFYGQLRGHKQDHAVKCELGSDRLRLIFLSSYDKKAKPTPPAKSAGEDGLGDLVIDPASAREQDFETLTLTLADIKRVETKNGQLLLKLAKEEVTLSPIYMAAATPTEGPQGRRFGNNYTRLFVRYPGLEDSKLASEGLTTGEKLKLVYDIANAGMTIATSLNPMGSVSALQSFIKISREIHGTVKSLRVNFAAWERTFEDQQALQTGSAFRPIPTAPVSLTFLEELK
ncbi:MAG TPA: tetratricopeptide repeat protein [Blastocatellia bacterium]|nr:tetratricopeptide repeat protein [Blastocatellia bacterium]